MVLNLLAKSFITSRTGGFLNQASTFVQRILVDRVYDNTFNNQNLMNYVQNRGAARKGKRIQRAREARLRANKRRLLEAQNPKPKKTRHNLNVDKEQLRFLTERELDLTLPNIPEDNVFFADKYRKKRFSFDEIIEFHRQVVHPEVLNVPDSLVSATIELNLKMKIKRKKYLENINSTLCYPHQFQYEVKPRKIVALCKNIEDQNAAREAGAVIAGSLDVANLLKTSQLTKRDFDHIVCLSDFLVDFADVKGMKGASFFPTKQRGNFGDNIVELVKFFKNGIDYSLRKNQDEPEYGFIDCYFGKLNMTNAQLRENLITFFNSVNRFKPLNLEDGKQFFQRVIIHTPASQEMFLLRFWDMIDDYQDPDLIVTEEKGNKASAAAA